MPSARTIAAPVAAAGLLAVPTVIAFSAGGFFEGAHLRAGIVIWVVLAVAALAAPRPLPASKPARLAVAGLLGFAIWTSVAVAWSPLRDPGLSDAARVWLYAGYVILAIVVLRPPVARFVEPGLAAGALVVTGYALGTRLLPTVVPSDRSPRAGARLDQPVTYWNALGLIAAIAIVLLLRLAADADRGVRARAWAAALVPVPGLALYLTFSRGSLIAVAAGVVVLLIVCRERAAVGVTVVCLGCAGLVAAGTTLFPAIDSLNGSEATQRTQGLAVLAILVAACAVAGLGGRAVARGAAERLRLRSAAALAAALLSVALAAGAALALTRSPAPPAPTLITRPGPGGQLPTTRGRLATLESNRYDYWRVALHGFGDKPLTGLGTHGFQQLWLERRPISENVQDAHSLYLETAAELGLIGFAWLALFLAGAAGAALRLGRTPGGRALVAGWLAVSATWLVHAGVDWDWEMPAATLPFLALVGAGLATIESRAPAAVSAGAGRAD